MKISFDADLTKVEKSAGKRPKANIDVFSTERDGVTHSASSIAALLMEITGPVRITIEPAQMDLDDAEDDEPAVSEAQMTVPLTMDAGRLVDTRTGESVDLAPEPTFKAVLDEVIEQVNDGALDGEGVTVTAELVPFEPTAEEIVEETAAAEEVVAETAPSGFSMEEPEEPVVVAPESTFHTLEKVPAGTFLRLFESEASVMLEKAMAGNMQTKAIEGIRYSAYKNPTGVLTLEVKDTSKDALVGAHTFFGVLGCNFTSRVIGDTTIFAAASLPATK